MGVLCVRPTVHRTTNDSFSSIRYGEITKVGYVIHELVYRNYKLYLNLEDSVVEEEIVRLTDDILVPESGKMLSINLIRPLYIYLEKQNIFQWLKLEN